MSIKKEKKTEIIKGYQLHNSDTGSSYIQVAILTERINNITEHLKSFKNDLHCKYGLLKLVSRRKKLLSYIKSNNQEEYYEMIKRLGIRK